MLHSRNRGKKIFWEIRGEVLNFLKYRTIKILSAVEPFYSVSVCAINLVHSMILPSGFYPPPNSRAQFLSFPLPSPVASPFLPLQGLPTLPYFPLFFSGLKLHPPGTGIEAPDSSWSACPSKLLTAYLVPVWFSLKILVNVFLIIVTVIVGILSYNYSYSIFISVGTQIDSTVAVGGMPTKLCK